MPIIHLMRNVPTTYVEALAWMAQHATSDLPTKMHDRATGDDGAPRLSEQFMRWVTRDEPEPGDEGWAFETHTATYDEDCPRQHPLRKRGEPRCELCDDALSWKKTRPRYVRPFMAALERLRKASPTSHDWPTPYTMVTTLMFAGYDLDVAARSIDHTILGPDHRATVEAAFTLAIRRLAERYSSGPIPRMRGISEAQGNAEAAA